MIRLSCLLCKKFVLIKNLIHHCYCFLPFIGEENVGFYYLDNLWNGEETEKKFQTSDFK